MPQDLIGCRKRRKLKAVIPRAVVFVNDPPSAERRIDFAVFYGRKICLNMCQKIHIFSGFALVTELMRVYRGVESPCTLLKANKVPFDSDAHERASRDVG